MVSVIIPALNEANTIRKVIQRIKQDELPLEVIVVDDNSTDSTVAEASKEGARVITSSKRGKGISMYEGMMAAAHDVIVYLDADILTYPKNIVSLLAGPIIQDEADFVKSYFDRQAGRVTQLVAKPLLSIFFPELEKFTQPLSGMIASKKSFLKDVEFENDYGVDIALLIDAYNKQLRIKEVNIGYIKNDMQSLVALGKMSRQVSRTILQKAALHSRDNLETLSNIHTISDEMDVAITESIQKLKKMVVIDMNVLLQNDFFEAAASEFNLEFKLRYIEDKIPDTIHKLEEITKLFKGKSLPELQAIVDAIEFKDYAEELTPRLKKEGYICVLMSDGYDVVANHIKNKLGFDYAFANHLKMERSVATGEIVFPEFFKDPEQEGKYDTSHLMKLLTEKFTIPEKNIVFFGNARQNIPTLQSSGLGIVTNTADSFVQINADKILPDGSLKPLISLLCEPKQTKPLFQRKSTKVAIGVGALAAGAALAGYFLFRNNHKKRDCVEQ